MSHPIQLMIERACTLIYEAREEKKPVEKLTGNQDLIDQSFLTACEVIPAILLVKDDILSMIGGDIFDLFLNSGANVNARDEKGNTPLHNLIEGQNFWNIFCSSKFCARGANVNAQNSDGDTPLHLACKVDFDGLAAWCAQEDCQIYRFNLDTRQSLHQSSHFFFARHIVESIALIFCLGKLPKLSQQDLKGSMFEGTDLIECIQDELFFFLYHR